MAQLNLKTHPKLYSMKVGLADNFENYLFFKNMIIKLAII